MTLAKDLFIVNMNVEFSLRCETERYLYIRASVVLWGRAFKRFVFDRGKYECYFVILLGFRIEIQMAICEFVNSSKV